jgi:hypothetical protein
MFLKLFQVGGRGAGGTGEARLAKNGQQRPGPCAVPALAWGAGPRGPGDRRTRRPRPWRSHKDHKADCGGSRLHQSERALLRASRDRNLGPGSLSPPDQVSEYLTAGGPSTAPSRRPGRRRRRFSAEPLPGPASRALRIASAPQSAKPSAAPSAATRGARGQLRPHPLWAGRNFVRALR